MKIPYPEIHYFDGKAVKIVQYVVQRVRGSEFVVTSEYTLKEDGSFTQWHEDLEHGTPSSRGPITKKTLDFYASKDHSLLPVSLILGKSYDDVCKILEIKDRNIKTKHLIWENLELLHK